MQIRCSTCWVILNPMATQYTCSLNGVYHPHWLEQWSRHRSHTRIPVHSPWLPGYIDVTQTTLVILTMVGLPIVRLVNTCLPSHNYLFVSVCGDSFEDLFSATLKYLNQWCLLHWSCCTLGPQNLFFLYLEVCALCPTPPFSPAPASGDHHFYSPVLWVCRNSHNVKELGFF